MGEETSIRINITIPKLMKENWEIFAEKIGQSLSSLIRLSVNEYIKRDKRDSMPIATNQEMITQQKHELESHIENKLNEFSSVLKTLTPIKISESDKDRIKSQIISILTDFPNGMEPKKLSAYCGVDREIIGDMLKEFSELGLTYMKRNFVVLKKEM